MANPAFVPLCLMRQRVNDPQADGVSPSGPPTSFFLSVISPLLIRCLMLVFGGRLDFLLADLTSRVWGRDKKVDRPVKSVQRRRLPVRSSLWVLVPPSFSITCGLLSPVGDTCSSAVFVIVLVLVRGVTKAFPGCFGKGWSAFIFLKSRPLAAASLIKSCRRSESREPGTWPVGSPSIPHAFFPSFLYCFEVALSGRSLRRCEEEVENVLSFFRLCLTFSTSLRSAYAFHRNRRRSREV